MTKTIKFSERKGLTYEEIKKRESLKVTEGILNKLPKEKSTVNLTLPVPPPLNNLYSNTKSGRRLSERGKAYKKEVHWIAIKEKVSMLSGDIKIDCSVYRPAKRGDLDNYLKGLIDSLSGILYLDDKQIIEIHAKRFDDKNNPRVEISIQEV